ncbi:hypothetical protein EDD16DRAFT_1249640 [Pisolithus croceorrhizus]|nr:hypothetical protein EDD16DRAFT_1249640 [Pisolithus croceorrhizus]KAI6119654.1 hypothetical protein EV401DRAFT_1488752 [Pisolithus croceorrhizus]
MNANTCHTETRVLFLFPVVLGFQRARLSMPPQERHPYKPQIMRYYWLDMLNWLSPNSQPIWHRDPQLRTSTSLTSISPRTSTFSDSRGARSDVAWMVRLQRPVE